MDLLGPPQAPRREPTRRRKGYSGAVAYAARACKAGADPRAPRRRSTLHSRDPDERHRMADVVMTGSEQKGMTDAKAHPHNRCCMQSVYHEEHVLWICY